jgi:transposase
MARKIVLEIRETVEELKKRLQKAKIISSRERLRMLLELKTQKVKTRKELGRILGRDEATITRWLKKYREGGLLKLLEVKKAPGKKKKISELAQKKLREKLTNESGVSSYGEIQKWLAEELGIKAAYHTVYKTVRYQLQAKLKKPRPSHPKKDKEKEKAFKKTFQQP